MVFAHERGHNPHQHKNVDYIIYVFQKIMKLDLCHRLKGVTFICTVRLKRNKK